MKSRLNDLFLLSTFIAALFVRSASGADRPPTSHNTDLEPFLTRYQLPAIAPAVVKRGEVLAAGAVGTRRTGFQLPVTLEDRFHLGLGLIDATVGHMMIDGKPKAFLPGPAGDNPTVVGPAGIAHMSVLDFARWAGWQAGEGRREPRLVREETLKTLHVPVISMESRTNAAPGHPLPRSICAGMG